jgi:hypothetical protein
VKPTRPDPADQSNRIPGIMIGEGPRRFKATADYFQGSMNAATQIGGGPHRNLFITIEALCKIFSLDYRPRSV